MAGINWSDLDAHGWVLHFGYLRNDINTLNNRITEYINAMNEGRYNDAFNLSESYGNPPFVDTIDSFQSQLGEADTSLQDFVQGRNGADAASAMQEWNEEHDYDDQIDTLGTELEDSWEALVDVQQNSLDLAYD